MTLGLGKLGENASHFRIHITTVGSFRAKRDRVAAPEENPFRKENHPLYRNQKLSLVAKRDRVAAPEENPFRKENHPLHQNQKLSLLAT